MTTICFTLSILLVYVMFVALVVTSCCMHFYKPRTIILITRDEECISVEFED
jgi:hypothetical protein